MTEPSPTEDNPSEHVLEELLDAFSVDTEAQTTSDKPEHYDFDDPSIDRLLGIESSPTGATDKAGPPPKVEAPKKEESKQVAPTTVEPPKKVGRKKKEAAVERKTIVIGDDDLPDAVPLDVEREEKFLERRGAEGNQDRSTIVIADFDDVEALDASAVRATRGSGDERIRARRISVRRAEGRRRLRWALVGLVVIAVPIASLAVLASPLFDVNEVSVQGASYTDSALLATIIDELTGDPVLLIDTQSIEERLRADPWVERVKVETDFPHRVVIDIRERTPVAAFQGGDGRFRIIDYVGRVLDVIDGIPIDYMMIIGDHPDTARGQFAGAPYSAAAELVLLLPAEIRAITDSVGLNAATGALSLQLAGGAVVQLGDASDMDEKLARLLSLLRGGLDGVCELDVSTREVGSVPC